MSIYLSSSSYFFSTIICQYYSLFIDVYLVDDDDAHVHLFTILIIQDRNLSAALTVTTYKAAAATSGDRVDGSRILVDVADAEACCCYTRRRGRCTNYVYLYLFC